MEDCPPSPQPGQVPQQPPQEPELPECLSPSDQTSVCIQPSHSEKTGSSGMTAKSSDKDWILRTLKLKELMKIERRKDIQASQTLGPCNILYLISIICKCIYQHESKMSLFFFFPLYPLDDEEKGWL